ncbi:hypothetical protein LXA43DRAFT_900842, partial [Ganoderma leucocontextum]
HEYLSHLLEREQCPPTATCGHAVQWRCLTCHGCPTFCTACCHTRHSDHPLHRVESWNHTHFTPDWLRHVGVEIHLGHGGQTCPETTCMSGGPRVVPVSDLPFVGITNRSADTSFPISNHSRMFVIVDSSGIHEIHIVFCSCPNGGQEDLQLLDMEYYPATITSPRTAFTFRALDDFLLANKECNVPPRNYYSLLRHFTNNVFPHMVPDRYKELLWLSRQWRNLKLGKWAGYGHRAADTISPGELAVLCLACPDPETNLLAGWQKDPLWWKYMCSAVMDGNFSAQHRPMKNPEDDVALADGHLFSVEDAPYKAHLVTAKEFTKPVVCHEHRAVLTASLKRGKYEAMGVGAAACSRHGFFIPHTCVDF